MSDYTNRERKLTEEQVRWFKTNYIKRDRKFGLRAIARQLNVSHVTLLKILNGIRYKDV